LGPLKLKETGDLALKYVNECGGRILTGGKFHVHSGSQGVFFEPTLVIGAPEDTAIMSKEVAGPVCCIEVVDSAEMAETAINSSPYGMSSAIYAEDEDLVRRMSHTLDTGTVYVNKCQEISPRLPWSGRR
jgi:acyl-CoA reductase-like NAD-dependent aldehyde dehydrogenase